METLTKNHAYDLVKSFKYFWAYGGYNRIHAFVQNILTQSDFLGSRVRCFSKFHEYYLQIWPKKIIRGQCLAEMLNEGNNKVIQMGEEEKVCMTTVELEEGEW